MRTVRLAAFALAAAAISPLANAQEKGSGLPLTNVYVGLDAGASDATNTCHNLTNCDSRDTTVRGFGGWQFHPRGAVEVAYSNLGIVKSDPSGTYMRASAWEATLVGNLPLPGDAFEVLGLLGAFRGAEQGGGALAAPKETHNGLTYGVGLQLNVMPSLAVRARWQNYPSMGGQVLPKGDINTVTVGALWRFK